MAKTVVERVRELEERNRLLTDHLIDAIWVVDVESMAYEYISSSIERISGFKAEELIGTSLKNRMSADSFAKVSAVVEESLSQLAKGKEPTRVFETELLHKNGSTYWLEVTVKAVKEGNKPLKAVGVSKDITHRRLLEKQQEKLVCRLRSALAEKDRLLKENRMLRDILPICSGCKRIRDENERWWPLDLYVERHTGSDFSHTICPDCRAVLYDER